MTDNGIANLPSHNLYETFRNQRRVDIDFPVNHYSLQHFVYSTRSHDEFSRLFHPKISQHVAELSSTRAKRKMASRLEVIQ